MLGFALAEIITSIFKSVVVEPLERISVHQDITVILCLSLCSVLEKHPLFKLQVCESSC